MSSYASIYLNGKEIFSYRNAVHPEASYFFSPDDIVHLEGSEAVEYAHGNYDLSEFAPDDIEHLEIIAYRATAGVIRERLNVLGYGMKVVREVFDEALEIELESQERMVLTLQDLASDPDHLEYFESQRSWLKCLKELTFESWQIDVRDHLLEKGQHISPDLRDIGALHLFESVDQRVIVRLLAELVTPADVFTLDVTDLSEGGWLDYSPPITGPSVDGDQNAGPPIVITEGRFDAKVLQESISVLRPHLAGYVRFLDYDAGNEGGAAAAVKMVKSFAAAGIANPVVALFDNDSAAHEAVLGLRQTVLPPHFRIAHYPALSLAESYPTLGPQGQARMDVNKLAGSIELYLGRDVLTGSDGELTPVQWKGYMAKVKAYQGEILEKGAVQKAFERKVAAAKSDASVVTTQDWSGVQAIIDTMIDALSS